MTTGPTQGLVKEYLDSRMTAAGVSPDKVTHDGEQQWLAAVLRGEQPVPMDRITEVAIAISGDPVELFSRCVAEYLPKTYAAVEPRLGSALTHDELVLIKNLRRWVGSAYLAALTDIQKDKLTEWLTTLREPVGHAATVH